MSTLAPELALALMLTVVGIAAVYLFSRKRRPRRRSFVCAHCSAKTPHSGRTVEAWRNGKAKFFCEPCHSAWMQEHSAPPLAYDAEAARSGCLGVLAAVTVLPALVVGAWWAVNAS